MRLKNSIFLWVFPATLVPLAIIGLAATLYMEQRYLAGVDEELTANLTRVAAAIERRLLIERDLTRRLAGVPAVTRFRDAVLRPLNRGEVAADAEVLRDRLNDFVETFQSVRVSLDTVRFLDADGNTLIKVREAQRVLPLFDGMGDMAFVEQERDDPGFREALASLAVGDVGSLLMMDDIAATGDGRGLPVYSSVMPMGEPGNNALGYLIIDPPLDPLNRALAVTARLHGARLTIAEFDHGASVREGLILYDDDLGVDLWSVRVRSDLLHEEYPRLHAAFQRDVAGMVDDHDNATRTYFQEFLPYPDRLTTWVLALRIDSESLTAPFRTLRIGILLSMLVALLLSLLLAGGVARRVARPMLTLTNGLAAFASGRRDDRITVDGPDEIQAAGLAFNDMADTIQAAERARDQAMAAHYRSRRLASLGEMAGGVAHEISNPVNTILSLTTLIERQLPDDADTLRDDVLSIREECERAAGTIRAIMSFSHDVEGERACFDVRSWLTDTVELVQHESRAGAIPVVLDAAVDCQLEGDRALLQRALRNLLDNAMQASPPDGRVEVRTRVDGLACVIEVLDRGPGLDEEQADRAFDPFYTTKPQGQGSGLGLSISQGIVQRHGGELELGNRPGGGAVARMMLPLAQNPSTGPEVA